MSKVLFIFLDGVGIGEPDPHKNPFWSEQFKFIKDNFNSIPSLDNQYEVNNKIVYFPVDAVMGVEGIPQSGTGQTSILCGINAQQKIGKHFGPFPYSELVPFLENESIFTEVQSMGKTVNFVNAYPKMFFEYLKSGRKRVGAFALSAILSGIKLKKSKDLWQGKGLSNDITNRRWRTKIGYKVKEISPEKAATRLLKLARKADLTVYEYFLTDHIGHGRNLDEKVQLLSDLDRFLTCILKNKNNDLEVVITSDHGNLEDIALKTHTKNPSLTIYSGKYFEYFYEQVKELSDIKWVIKKILEF